MTQNFTFSLTVQETERLDKALASAVTALREAGKLPEAAAGLSRARLQQLLKEGQIVRKEPREEKLDAKYKTQAGETFLITLPPPAAAEPEAQTMPLAIVYEDEDVLVLDKPAGLVVHPAAGHWDHTLVNGLLAHCGESLSGIGGVARPGIVHRLDKDTSGLMVIAKNDRAHQSLTAQFADRTLSRTYQAVVWGVPAPLEGSIEERISRHPRARQKMAVVFQGGKEALTHYTVLEAFGTIACLVECQLATGRTHQIRVHMEHIGHPVVGDPLYGSRRRAQTVGETGIVGLLEGFPRQALHAVGIKFKHPKTGKILKFKTKLPNDFDLLLKRLRKPI